MKYVRKTTGIGLVFCSLIFLFGFLDCEGETNTGGGALTQLEIHTDGDVSDTSLQSPDSVTNNFPLPPSSESIGN